MKVTQEAADLFFRLMWGLQFYVNQQLELLPGVDSVEAYRQLSYPDHFTVRDALWDHPELIDGYVQENPLDLPSDELAVVSKWTNFVSGTFFIERLLKKHAVFIGDEAVYGVLALHDPFEKMFAGYQLPISVEAVLLPFQGKIVYDGILVSHRMVYGGGIKAELREEYMAAKQNDRIVTTLEPGSGQAQEEQREPTNTEWLPVLDEMMDTLEGMRGGPAVQSAAMTLMRAAGALAQAAVGTPEDLDELWRLESQVRRALTRLQRTLERAER